MKNLLIGFISFISLIFFTNCTSQMSNTENTKREWMLVEFQDFTKELMVKNKAKLDLSSAETGKRFTANMGCNSMFGQATFKANNKVEFSQIGSTMMYCDQNMGLETAFGKILPTMTSYKIEGHRLTLSNDKGEIMKFIASDWD